ncbi:16S rRNA (adenine(1518)-N(6)/adenine(1519)-N(6))-dimethyltransferase RsmA [Mechercharimyces sp. CAU 1602]|nr:16S rRNA (adenine(1518)-N(6)/adenine(1519)-N(6))-dimethyltransferase RsmA [Mechercharimyces sp. CAU 1602]MCS1352368.1 16S rRNA (adenine(1518)-N(6)/adenine(1519)-N(6))-dimethyltransferase RsmA [Mechercharimyces sp. CAU 1602]
MEERTVTRRTRELLKKHNLRLKRSLGQNFITEDWVLDRIVEAASLDRQTGVLEIGPGIGALTERIAEEAGWVTAIETDSRLIPVLEDQFATTGHVHIVEGDALQLDLQSIVKEHMASAERYCVVANLPYYITSPLIMRLLEGGLPLERIVIMIQKEVAERIMADPGGKDYGMLSIAVQYYAIPHWVTKVPNHVFVPRPDVDSAVIQLEVRGKPAVDVIDESLFFQVVRAAFAKRRKTLLNSISTSLPKKMSKEDVRSALEQAGIEPNRRGETCSLAEFARLTDALADFGM